MSYLRNRDSDGIYKKLCTNFSLIYIEKTAPGGLQRTDWIFLITKNTPSALTLHVKRTTEKYEDSHVDFLREVDFSDFSVDANVLFGIPHKPSESMDTGQWTGQLGWVVIAVGYEK